MSSFVTRQLHIEVMMTNLIRYQGKDRNKDAQPHQSPSSKGHEMIENTIGDTPKITTCYTLVIQKQILIRQLGLTNRVSRCSNEVGS